MLVFTMSYLQKIVEGSDLTFAEAEALIEAATGGAQRHRGRMIESMHVDEARRTIERARHTTGS